MAETLNKLDVLFVTAATPTGRLYAKYSYPWQRLAVGTGRLGLKVAVCAPAWLLSPTRVVNWLKSFSGPEEYSSGMGLSPFDLLQRQPISVGGVPTYICDTHLHRPKIRALLDAARIIQFSSVWDFRACYGVLGERLLQKTYVMNPQRSCLKLRRRMGDLWGKMLASASAVVMPSDSVSRKFRRAGLSGESHLIPYGIAPAWYDTPKSRAGPSSSARTSLVCACGLTNDKGVARLLRAVGHAENTQLTVIGEGPCRQAFMKLARATGSSGRVRFTGWLSAEEMIPHLDACDAFVLPSPKETLGLVYLEALARRVPILGIVNQGIHGMFPGCANTGFMSPVFDAEELRVAVRKIMAARPFENCRCGRCMARYDFEMTARAFAEVYASLFERGM